jgi:hypothetical protein
MIAKLKCALGAFVLVFGVGACGSDDDGDGGSGSNAAAVSACNSYCDAQQTANCGNYDSADQCKSDECGGLSPQAPAACGNAVKAYYDCLNASSDICSATCETEGGAMLNACSG